MRGIARIIDEVTFVSGFKFVRYGGAIMGSM